MSKEVFTQVIRGAHEWVRQAEEALEEAVAKHGADTPVGWGPATAYNLPMSYSLMGLEVKTVGEMKPQVEHARELLRPVPTDALWLPYLGDGLDATCGLDVRQAISRRQLPPGSTVVTLEPTTTKIRCPNVYQTGHGRRQRGRCAHRPPDQ